MKYKVIETSVSYLNGIELEYDFSEVKLNGTITILGLELSVNQLGSVIGMSNKDTILVCQEITAEV